MDQNCTIKVDVTAIEIIDDFIYAGIGNSLYVQNISKKEQIYSYRLFQKHRIHGIRLYKDRNKLVCFGNREIVVASINFTHFDISIVSRFTVDDWILDVKYNYEELIVLCANNSVALWNWKAKCIKKSAFNRVKCLLFSGLIIGNEWDESIVIAGTMFKSILIWAPSDSVEKAPPVLHKLTGHNGAIFSLFYHHKLKRLCSTSDDRSVRIWYVHMPKKFASVIQCWTEASINLMITVYGHVSRVWRSIILDNGEFLTSGEDSQLRLWSENGKPLYSWIAHQGAPIRSLSVIEKKNIIVTGGGDGGISLWPLSNADHMNATEKIERIKFSDVFGLVKVQDIPKRILLSRLGKLFTITKHGSVLCYDGSNWRCVVHDERYADYCIFQICPNRRCVSLASIRGDVTVLRESVDGTLQPIFDGNICSSRIFSFHWLSDFSFITCCDEGRMEIWTLQKDETCDTLNVRKESDLILPPGKERWLTVAIQVSNSVIVGDRGGSLHLYSNNGQFYPTQTYNRIHGRLGVSYVDNDSEKGCLLSVGRDGFVRYWRVLKNELHLLASDRLPMKWPVRVIRTNLYGLLIIGFNEIDFEVWNIEERKKLLTCTCGGGHRPWDFYFDDNVHFVFIKRKVVYSLTVAADRLKVVSFLDGYHIREVNCLQRLRENIFISGSEDTTLRVFSIDSSYRLKNAFILRSHVSSVKAISFLLINDFILIISVGGRAQLNVCKLHTKPSVTCEELASHMLKSEEKRKKSLECLSSASLDLEPRHMDVDLHLQNDTVFIYCAGSDAFWRIFSFDLNTNSIKVIQEIEYANFCVLKIIKLRWTNTDFVVTFSSDGKVTFWNDRIYAIVYQKTIHQSSINSCDYVILDDNRLILATGGDDAVVKLSVFKNACNRIEEMSSESCMLHEANVSGVKIISNYIISAGCDKKILLWKWSVRNSKPEQMQLRFIRMYHSIIADIHGLAITCMVDNTHIVVCVYGAGFETLLVQLKED